MVQEDPALETVPTEYFNERFRLNKSNFLITSNDHAMKLNEDLSRYLEIVESNLAKNIQKNFDFFTQAFKNFDGMKEDMQVIASRAASMRGHNERLQ